MHLPPKNTYHVVVVDLSTSVVWYVPNTSRRNLFSDLPGKAEVRTHTPDIRRRYKRQKKTR